MKKSKNSLKANKGITLIALVITIIVLLILAGVTITALSGENGLLTRASDASRETEIASVKEQAQIDITNWMTEKIKNGENAFLEDWQEIKQILDEANSGAENKYYKNVTEEGVETPNGYIIPIEELYIVEPKPVFDANNLTIGEAINVENYGKKVTNYTKKTSAMSTEIWRLFYQDNNYTYLITDDAVGRYETDIDSYANGTEVSIVGQKLNPELLNKGGIFTATNEDTSIKATAWLTDTSETAMWAEYKNEDAVFAIGSPTLELYIASYNATAEKYSREKITFTTGTYGYMPGGGYGEIKSSFNNGIYLKSSQSSNVWIASPSRGGNGMWVVNHMDGRFSEFNVTSSFLVRPIVCIPTSVFNKDYSLE